VRAAEWNADAEIGGGWTVTVQRLTGDTVATLATPLTLDLWRRGLDAATAPPTLSVSGVLAGNSKSATFTLTPNQVATLGRGTFESRLTIGDPATGPQVMTRGWFVVRGGMDDL
jgi:hypothetical protein